MNYCFTFTSGPLGPKGQKGQGAEGKSGTDGDPGEKGTTGINGKDAVLPKGTILEDFAGEQGKQMINS